MQAVPHNATSDRRPFRKVTTLPAGGRIITTEQVNNGRSVYRTVVEGVKLYDEGFPRVDHNPIDAISTHERIYLKSRAAIQKWKTLRGL